MLSAQGKLDFRTFLMANVGEDSEHPGTLRYVREYAMPYAAEHGIELVMLDRIMLQRTGEKRTLYGQLTGDLPCLAVRPPDARGWPTPTCPTPGQSPA